MPWLSPLLLRLHFLAGLFVGPFVLVAALSGAVYALAPSIERGVYTHELTAPSTSTARPLADQVTAAQAWVDARHPGDTVVEVRPAAERGATTRVMFSEDGLLDGQTRAVFVDPGDAAVRGDLPVYGTSGSLPFRTWISTFHRSLFLGDVGRLYSETAASWLGIVTLAGIVLWVVRLRRARRKRELLVPDNRARGYRRTSSWHAATGVWVLVGALFLSATGITWSHFAGDSVSAVRASLSWQAPVVDTALGSGVGATSGAGGEHAGHHGGASAPAAATVRPEQFDAVLGAARDAGIRAAEVKVRPAATSDQAWVVEEIRIAWPVAASAVAIDARDLSVVSQTDWDAFPLPAKLAEWGIDTHMGALWGLPNQIVLFVAALGIAAMVVFGYAMWWQRRPPGTRVARAPAAGALARAPWWGVSAVVVASVGIGLLLPTVGVTLLGFLVVDAVVATSGRRGARRWSDRMTGATANERTGWRSAGSAAVYWVVAGFGVVGGTASWLFLYSMSEEATRGATPDRSGANPNTGIAVGGLVVGHLVGLVVLVLAAHWARRDPRSAARFAGVALVADSLVGLALSLLLTGGHLVVPWPDQPYQP